jgi:ribosomal protein S18 acetylase RimI-like enzyme
MIQTRLATEPEKRAWLHDWRTRLHTWYDKPDVPAGWASRQADDRIAGFEHATESAVLALTEDGDHAGIVALSLSEFGGRREAAIADLWVAPQRRRSGLGGQAVRRAEDWAREHQASGLWAITDPADPDHAALFARYPVRSRHMMKALSGPGGLPEGLESRAMTEAEFAGWRAEVVRGYAADIADAGAMTPDEGLQAAEAQTDEILPLGLTTPGHAFLCLCAGGEVVATNWIQHHRTPGVSWVYSVETREDQRGKGYGRAAMVIGERATLEAGDGYLALNVFGHNDIAVGLYRSMGYREYDSARSIDL